jgi:hypothetical protein
VRFRAGFTLPPNIVELTHTYRYIIPISGQPDGIAMVTDRISNGLLMFLAIIKNPGLATAKPGFFALPGFPNPGVDLAQQAQQD